MRWCAEVSQRVRIYISTKIAANGASNLLNCLFRRRALTGKAACLPHEPTMAACCFLGCAATEPGRKKTDGSQKDRSEILSSAPAAALYKPGYITTGKRSSLSGRSRLIWGLPDECPVLSFLLLTPETLVCVIFLFAEVSQRIVYRISP